MQNTYRDYCIKANRSVAFGLRLRLHTEVCSLQTSPSVPRASSFLQGQDNLAGKIVRLLTFATVSYAPPPNIDEALHTTKVYRAFSIRLHSRRKATTYPQY